MILNLTVGKRDALLQLQIYGAVKVLEQSTKRFS